MKQDDPEFEAFKKNYTGIIKPEIAFAEAKARAEVKAGKFRSATYSPSYNSYLERQYIAAARRSAGGKW